MTSNYFETKLDKRTITEKKQLITSEGSYSLFIKQNNTNGIEFFIGGTKGGCLIIFIEDKDGDTFLLDSLKYDSKCNLQEDLKESSGTKHMMNTAFSYVKKYYPNIKFGTFYDRSNKECKSKLSNGSTPSLDLGLTHLMLKKKTWYESVIGATIKDISIKIKYDDFVSKLETIPINKSFNAFINKYFRTDLLFLHKINQKYNLDLPNLYARHKYYYTLFKELREKITDEIDSCMFFGMCMYSLMSDISNQNSFIFMSTVWHFPLYNNDLIKNIDFSEQMYNIQLSGGSRKLNDSFRYLFNSYLNNVNTLELIS